MTQHQRIVDWYCVIMLQYISIFIVFKAVEAEVVILKAILEPLQQKEMNHYSKKRETAIQNMRENFYRKQGKILCDGGMNDDEKAGVDVEDSFLLVWASVSGDTEYCPNFKQQTTNKFALYNHLKS